MTEEAPVLFHRLSANRGVVGEIVLNRPDALHALNVEMCSAITQHLEAWKTDSMVQAVIIRSSGGKAFCAGGDIRSLYRALCEQNPAISEFFWNEYRLNDLIHHYPKPYIAWLDGITMGGGAGLSMHGRYRIGSEKCVFAMPETTIGFYPDVGGSYFLNRCPHHIGTYLGLTGDRLYAADAHFARLLTHTIASEDWSAVLDRILEAATIDALHLDQIFAEAQTHFLDRSHLHERVTELEAIFSHPTIEEVIAAYDSPTLDTKCPLSLKLTFELLKRMEHASVRECLRIEYRLTQHSIEGSNFREGIRALLIDKDQKPVWQPSQLKDVSEAMIARYFEPMGEDLTFIET